MGPGVKSTAVLTTERETAGHHVPPDGSVRSYQGRHLAKKRKEKKSEPGQAPRSDFHLQDKDRMGVRGAAPWGGGAVGEVHARGSSAEPAVPAMPCPQQGSRRWAGRLKIT